MGLRAAVSTEREERRMESNSFSEASCSALPPLLSSFVDAFVDFSVGGLFFPSSHNSISAPQPDSCPTRIPAPKRLVAIGDLHGDLAKAREVLAVAGLTDPATSRWTGGAAVAVQVGDVLDRGGDELRLLYLLHRLRLEATQAGGALLVLHGNHEVLNVDGDFRYATRAALDEFKNWAFFFRAGIAMKRLVPGLEGPRDPFKGIPKSFPGIKEEYWEGIRARIAALQPDGPISRRFLSGNPTILVVGDSVFVHGGLLRDHIAYGIEKINEDVRDWILGLKGRSSPNYMRTRDSVVWLRRFSEEVNCDCGDLEAVLAMIPGARRMVMGHTIQEEINGVCDNRALRIDVGLSKGCSNGLPEVLEINSGGELRVLTSNRLYERKDERPVVRDEAREGLDKLVRESRLKEMEAQA